MEYQNTENATFPLKIALPPWHTVFEPTFFDKALEKTRKAGGILFGAVGASGLMATAAYEIGLVKVIIGVTLTAPLSISIAVLSTALIVMGIAIYRLKTSEDMARDIKSNIDGWAAHYAEVSKKNIDDQMTVLFELKKQKLKKDQQIAEERLQSTQDEIASLERQLDIVLKKLKEEKENKQQYINQLKNEVNRLKAELEENTKQSYIEFENLRLRLEKESEEMKAIFEKEQAELIRKKQQLLLLHPRPPFLQKRQKEDHLADMVVVCKDEKQVYFYSRDFYDSCDLYNNTTRRSMKEGQAAPTLLKCEDGKERICIDLSQFDEKTLRLLKEYLYTNHHFFEISPEELINLYLLSDELQIMDLKEICGTEIKKMIGQNIFSLESLFVFALDPRFSFLKGTYEEPLVREFLETKYENLSDLSKVDLSSLDDGAVRKMLDDYHKDDTSAVQKFYFLIQWAIQSKKKLTETSEDEKEKSVNELKMKIEKKFEGLLRYIGVEHISYQDYKQVFELVNKIYGEVLEKEVQFSCKKFFMHPPISPIQAMLNFLPFSGHIKAMFAKRINEEIASFDFGTTEQNTFFLRERELILSHLSFCDIVELISNLDGVHQDQRDFLALRFIMNWIFGCRSIKKWSDSFPNEKERCAFIEEKRQLLSTIFEGKNGAQVQIWDFVNFDRLSDNEMFSVYHQLTLFFPNETKQFTEWQNTLRNVSKESRARLGENHPRYKG